jgi:hypothetical protein
MAKAPPFPSILIANDLIDGDVIFASASGWVRHHGDARIATSEADAEALLEVAAKALANNKIVDPYLVEVAVGADGIPEPIHYREKMRTLGPSIRSDLGKQAERGARNVSL